MKKSLVALAVLAAAGAASAQSSVTLFGIVDASISHYDVKSTSYSTGLFPPVLVVPVGVKKSQTALSSSGYNTSRIGFRGTEDLGGGLAASFWLESSLANDSGSGSLNWARRSTVSLSGGFGEVRLGRDYVPTFWNDTTFDPFGTTGVGTNLISTISTNLFNLAGAGTPAIGLGGSDTYVRSSNSVGYFLPPNLGGFYGQVMYGLHENIKVSNALDPNPSKRGRYVGGRFGYANGPLDVALAYGQATQADGLLFDEKIKTLNLGASYDFGVVKLFGELSQVKDEQSFNVTGFNTNFNDKYNGALIGASVPVGAGLIRASFAHVKFKNDLGPILVPTFFGTSNFNSTADKLALGYVHNLSKRTALYATVARVRIKHGENNPGVMGANTGGGNTLTYLTTGLVGGVPTTGFAPRSSTGYDFGIRHSF